MISYFGTYLAYENKEGNIYTYLKPDAAKRAKAATWDPIKYEAISEENKALEMLMNEADNIDWLQDPNKSRELECLQEPKPSEQDVQHSRSAFLYSQDTESFKTFSPDRASDDDTTDLTTVPDSNQNDMSVITGMSNGASVSTKASEVIAAYRGMQNMMIGLERMLKSQAQAHNNDDYEVGNPSSSARPLSPPGVMRQT